MELNISSGYSLKVIRQYRRIDYLTFIHLPKAELYPITAVVI
jgi:hypothetical protein